MGRIADLCGEVAAMAEEGPEGLVLPPEGWDQLRADWDDEDIEDALRVVHESLMQGELVEAADSLSARLVEILGAFGERKAFDEAQAGHARLTLEILDQLARRVSRLEEILETFREGSPVDHTGLDRLQRHLANVGIEEEMERGRPPSGLVGPDGEEEEE